MSWPRKGERVIRSIRYNKILQGGSARYFPKVWGEPKWIRYPGQGGSGTSAVQSTLALVQGRWEMIRWSRASPRQSKPARGEMCPMVWTVLYYPR